MTRRTALQRGLCLLPLCSLVAVELYVRNFDGWGAWATAPVLLVPGVVSLVVVLWSRVRSTSLSFSLVAALPLLWLAARRFIL